MKFRPTLELWPLLVLCLLLATRWMLADAWPGTVSTVSSEACAALLAAAAWLALALRQHREAPVSRGKLASGFVAGALLFAGLNPGLLFPGVQLKSSDLMIGFALTPIVIAVALVAAEGAADGLNGSDLLPGLLAGAGLLLILPQPSLSSLPGDALLLLAPLCVGLGAVWLAARANEPQGHLRMGTALLGAAVAFGVFALKSPRMAPPLAATALDLLTLVLTLLTLQRLGARRFGAQFAAVPFLLLLEGIVFSRVLPNWLQAGGLLLLLVAALLLFRRPSPAAEEQRIPLLQ